MATEQGNGDPFAAERRDSFPDHRGYPSQIGRSRIKERHTNDSHGDERGIQRQETGDFEPGKRNKRLKFTIPLKYNRKRLQDEEHGYFDEKGGQNGFGTPLDGIDREYSSGSQAFQQAECLEIVSTQYAVPEDDGQEVVTLTYKDGAAKAREEQLRCESRWKHIQSTAMTFRDFMNQVMWEIMRTPGLDDADSALAGRLLNKVHKTCEKQFVHGRFLKPVTLVYEGQDPEHPTKIHKTATFISLPVFTTESPRRHVTTRHHEIHPVRGLLQSRYRLESTKRREKEQVITKTEAHKKAKKDHVVHVPQMWAIVINKYTIITCAPLDVSALRGDTIQLLAYSQAQLNEATWSVHFTDASGNVFYLPLRFCKTWFGLVKQIAEDCLEDDEFHLIRDQLLKQGPLYKLVTEDGTRVTADSWALMVEKERTEIIRLRLIDKEKTSTKLLITCCDEDGNEYPQDSDVSSEAASIFSIEEENSCTSESSIESVSEFKDIGLAVEKLKSLRNQLHEAEDLTDSKRVKALKDQKIPSLEEHLLNLTAESVYQEMPEKAVDPRLASLDSPVIDENSRGSAHTLPGHVRFRGADGYSYLQDQSKPRSRSRSRRRPNIYGKGDARSRSAYDLSTTDRPREGRPRLGIRTQSSREAYHPNGLVYPPAPREDSRDRDYRRAHSHIHSSRLDPRLQSYKFGEPTVLQGHRLAKSARARWDSVRTRVLTGSGFDTYGTPVSPTTEIYYKPSEKQLARSRWEFLRNKILEGADLGQGKKPESGNDENQPSSPRVRDKFANAMKSFISDRESLTSRRGSDIPVTLGSHGGKNIPKSSKKVAFDKSQPDNQPSVLKKLIQAAKNESPTKGKIETPSLATNVTVQNGAKEVEDLPIFLWSTPYKPIDVPDMSNTSSKPSTKRPTRLSDVAENETQASGKPDNDTAQTPTTTRNDEFTLYTVLSSMHNYIIESKKVSPEYVNLYKKTVDKAGSEVDAVIGVLEKDLDEFSRQSEDTGSPDPDGEDPYPWNLVEVERLRRVRDLRSTTFNLAKNILYAFVPEGYETSVLSKYWGALHTILHTDNEDVLDYVTSRLQVLYNLIRSIQMGVRTDEGTKQARYQIPRALPLAFQHLVLLLVIISNTSDWTPYSWEQMRKAFDDCENFLVEGRKQLILMIHTDDYREAAGFQAVDAEALLSLLLANLVDSLSSQRDFHLTEVYSEYTTKVQTNVRDRASVKVYDDIKLLREELDVIHLTLKQQDETLRDFRSTLNITYGTASLSASVIDRTLESLSQRLDDFNELQMQADTARFLAAQSISLKAESNNKAIIVFTVVTLIFLPLSFVTSYLGMNTKDIRQTERSQRLFWELGAPVTAGVLVGATVVAFYGTLTQRVMGRAWKEKAD